MEGLQLFELRLITHVLLSPLLLLVFEAPSGQT